MQNIVWLSLLLFSSGLRADNGASFDEVVDQILREQERETFDLGEASQELAKVASIEQLASFLGHESPTLQVCVVHALAKKNREATLLFFHAGSPEVRIAVAEIILAPPILQKGIPLLARSLEYGPGNQEFLALALQANEQMGEEDSVDRVVRFSVEPTAPLEVREQALESIAQLESLSPKNVTLLKDKAERFLLNYGRGDFLSPQWLSDAIQICQKHQSPIDSTILSGFALNRFNNIKVQLVALEELLVRSQSFEHVLHDFLSRDTGHAIEFLQSWHQQAPEAAMKYCRNVIHQDFNPLWKPLLGEKTVALTQSQLQFLSGLKTPQADDLLSSYLKAIAHQGAGAMELWLEAEEAISLRGDTLDPAAKELFRKTQDKEKKETGPENDYLSLLYGGNIRQGEELIRSKKGRCTECHHFQYKGNFAKGPDLYSYRLVAPREILRSLIAPSHDLAPGYGTTEIVLDDGSKISGAAALSENREQLIITTEGGQLTTIDVKDIQSQTFTSPMPSALDYLSPREIRDIVSFLSY